MDAMKLFKKESNLIYLDDPVYVIGRNLKNKFKGDIHG